MNFTNGAACSVELGGWWWWCGMGVISMVGWLDASKLTHEAGTVGENAPHDVQTFESETRRKGTEGETGGGTSARSSQADVHSTRAPGKVHSEKAYTKRSRHPSA